MLPERSAGFGFFFFFPPQSHFAATFCRVLPSALSIHEPGKLNMLNNLQLHASASYICMGQISSKPP